MQNVNALRSAVGNNNLKFEIFAPFKEISSLLRKHKEQKDRLNFLTQVLLELNLAFAREPKLQQSKFFSKFTPSVEENRLFALFEQFYTAWQKLPQFTDFSPADRFEIGIFFLNKTLASLFSPEYELDQTSANYKNNLEDHKKLILNDLQAQSLYAFIFKLVRKLTNSEQLVVNNATTFNGPLFRACPDKLDFLALGQSNANYLNLFNDPAWQAYCQQVFASKNRFYHKASQWNQDSFADFIAKTPAHTSSSILTIVADKKELHGFKLEQLLAPLKRGEKLFLLISSDYLYTSASHKDRPLLEQIIYLKHLSHCVFFGADYFTIYPSCLLVLDKEAVEQVSFWDLSQYSPEQLPAEPQDLAFTYSAEQVKELYRQADCLSPFNTCLTPGCQAQEQELTQSYQDYQDLKGSVFHAKI
ncbi:hypothetical protein CJP74_00340 [Psittacicella melopsittaci]|uniref:Uncharacterized protein n=1 Tax=Psittacicella melopsittaci TaxID=2028576 RepID=A0A3A1Y710_9GAMM|nr:hypothetical protein [Psittacicella melopsittaci]RIY34063.1 hypothetical protein CJP74_00340 [Psittacicella melopsittaci]